MVIYMSRVTTSINILESLKKEGEKAVKSGKFPGITSFGGLVEYALHELLENKSKNN
jgi:hypothetical protein